MGGCQIFFQLQNLLYYNLKEKGRVAFESLNLDCCLLYTSDAADERSSVDLGGRRIIKKKKE